MPDGLFITICKPNVGDEFWRQNNTIRDLGGKNTIVLRDEKLKEVLEQFGSIEIVITNNYGRILRKITIKPKSVVTMTSDIIEVDV